MKKLFSSRFVLAGLALCVLFASIALYLEATVMDDVLKIAAECREYCEKYSGPANDACFHGCIFALMV